MEVVDMLGLSIIGRISELLSSNPKQVGETIKVPFMP